MGGRNGRGAAAVTAQAANVEVVEAALSTATEAAELFEVESGGRGWLMGWAP